ncbi:PQQ-dependent sugar dehydrogenase [Gloeobacter morelensis]|uniref:Sorbosone dehydrogenase family protein n=1 Tax=Gloeobacter morelensis MG652769 TaxID=2781736 RepID=A0ABY3PSL3_9CYAN|nr:sorbosone dehydrogenase family protein [Gloeobacter morelensis]UFP96472.1 sorbosone dehydrogenase family protein [Gloeobacter morelensis MG652769]
MRALTLAALLLVFFPWYPAQAAPNLDRIDLPPGFSIGIFAQGLDRPRAVAFAPNGDLFVTEIGAGRVSVLPDRDGNGKADRRVTFAGKLDDPHGLAFYNSHLYIGETGKVARYPYQSGQLEGRNRQVVVNNLPSGGGHFTRTVAFGPDDKMYVSIGSTCNVCVERDKRRATVMQFNPDGSGGRIYASGLRNAVGLRFDSAGRLWATSNGRDWLGDDTPPDELHILEDGMSAGWPFCHAGKYKDPEPKYAALGSCEQVKRPVWGFQAHSAPLGVSEYTGTQFPPEYRGDLFVAFHGSWNRSRPTGYKVVRAEVEDGKIVRLSDFATGWLRPDREVVGRPVDVLAGPDGSLFVTDDGEGVIYRIRYTGQ